MLKPLNLIAMIQSYIVGIENKSELYVKCIKPPLERIPLEDADDLEEALELMKQRKAHCENYRVICNGCVVVDSENNQIVTSNIDGPIVLDSPQ